MLRLYALPLIQIASSTAAFITFEGTAQTGLDFRSLPEGLQVSSIHDLIRRTHAYHEVFEATPLPPFDSGEPTTEIKPQVLLVNGTSVTPGTTHASPYGFVSTAMTAYARHTNLIIRPDDIWVTILAQFGLYVNARAEALRDRFVDHDGKKELKVMLPPSYSISTIPWDDFVIPTFLELIEENLANDTLVEWLTPDFSTTQPVDRVAAAAAVMCALQKYFEYTVLIVCGIPRVTLSGTVNDWMVLRAKIDRLVDFDDGTGILSNEWIPLLRTVLDNFVVSSETGSSTNLQFWDQIVFSTEFLCGVDQISGWLSVFTFFNQEGQKQVSQGTSDPWPVIDVNDLSPNVLACPIGINDQGLEYNSTLFVGQMSFDYILDPDQTIPVAMAEEFDEDVYLIVPRNDWAVAVHETEYKSLIRPGYENPHHQLIGAGSGICRSSELPPLELYETRMAAPVTRNSTSTATPSPLQGPPQAQSPVSSPSSFGYRIAEHWTIALFTFIIGIIGVSC